MQSGSIRLPNTRTLTLAYRSLEDLRGRYDFHGDVGSEKLSLSLKRPSAGLNDLSIEGNFLEPRPGNTDFIFGSGDWNPELQLSGDDGQLSGTIGRQQGAYDGIALPSAGMDKIFGSAT